MPVARGKVAVMPAHFGEAAPRFVADTPSIPGFEFDTIGGVYVLLAFLPDDQEGTVQMLRAMAQHRAMFDGVKAIAFQVTRDPTLAAQAKDIRGLSWFLDLDGQVSRLYGAAAEEGTAPVNWVLIDPSLRVMGTAGLAGTDNVFRTLASLPPPGQHAGTALHAPILIVPRVFEPELCEQLVALHAETGGTPTGVMRDLGDRTVAVMDPAKSRRDVIIEDPVLRNALKVRLERRLFPAIEQATAFACTHIERYLVSRYDADEGGLFRAHRDDTTMGTAHRRFACSINLNDGFVGGDLRFPEFGPRAYRPPVGGAVIFSCNLLHEVLPLTEGRRYVFVPFLFDEAAAAIRAAYEARVGDLSPET